MDLFKAFKTKKTTQHIIGDDINNIQKRIKQLLGNRSSADMAIDYQHLNNKYGIDQTKLENQAIINLEASKRETIRVNEIREFTKQYISERLPEITQDIKKRDDLKPIEKRKLIKTETDILNVKALEKANGSREVNEKIQNKQNEKINLSSQDISGEITSLVINKIEAYYAQKIQAVAARIESNFKNELNKIVDKIERKEITPEMAAAELKQFRNKLFAKDEKLNISEAMKLYLSQDQAVVEYRLLQSKMKNKSGKVNKSTLKINLDDRINTLKEMTDESCGAQFNVLYAPIADYDKIISEEMEKRKKVTGELKADLTGTNSNNVNETHEKSLENLMEKRIESQDFPELPEVPVFVPLQSKSKSEVPKIGCHRLPELPKTPDDDSLIKQKNK